MAELGTLKNVLLISFDDAVAFWKYKTMFGEVLQTPNLDRICAQSTAFHSAYCQAPVCSPSRASFMTGLSPHQTGITGPKRDIFDNIRPEDTWPCHLKTQGFYTSSGGKVVRGFVPLLPEAHETIYSDEPKKFRVDWKVPKEISVEFGGFRGGRATADEKHDGRFYDYQCASSAISFFNTYQDDAPFYREVGFYGPHGPWITPRRFKDMYDASRIRKPRAWSNGFEPNAFMDEIEPGNIDNTRVHNWRKSVRNYFSALTHTDQHLGRVWDALKASDHADNTLVVILSDHGLHLGERNRFRKHTLWEQVANVPLIIHDPRNPVAQVVSDPVALVDVAPTVMDYLGQPALEDRPGRSLRSYMNWERDPDRAIPTFLHQSASIRKGKYRLIKYEDGSAEFFDLAQDWWQTQNLGTEHPDYREMELALEETCDAYTCDAEVARA